MMHFSFLSVNQIVYGDKKAINQTYDVHFGSIRNFIVLCVPV